VYKKKIHIIIAIIAAILIPLFLLNPLEIVLPGDTTIQISDTGSVNRIEIYGLDTIFLQRQPVSGWLMNNTYDVNPVSVNNFLFCFKKMGIRGISYDMSFNDSISRRIHIFSGRKKHFFRFYHSENKYLLHKEGSKKIFSVEVTGSSKADLSEVFSDDPDHWRNRIIMDLLPEEISLISISHTGKPEYDFMVRMENHVPVLYEPSGSEAFKPEVTDTEQLNRYMSYFLNIFYEYGYRGEKNENISFSSDPEYVISVTPVSREKITLSVYSLFREGKKDIFFAGVKVDDNPQMLVIRYIAIDLILARKSDFIRTPVNSPSGL